MIWQFLMKGWLALSIAILASVVSMVCMKLSHGLRRLLPTIFLFIFYIVSFVAMTFALQYIELSILYAVWSGIDTLLVVAVGAFYFNEAITIRKMIFLTLIIIGVVGIHLS